MVFIKILQTKTAINASRAMRNDSFSLNFFSNQIQCSHVFLIIQFPESSNLKKIILYCRRNARFPVHSSPHKKFQKCATLLLIRPDYSHINSNNLLNFTEVIKDVREWQFLTMKAAETLCIVCLPPEEHIS